MKSPWIYLSIGLLTSLFLLVSHESTAAEEAEADVVTVHALLDDGAGEGLCIVKQDGGEVWAKVTVVRGFTPNSAGTAWIKFDGETVRRLDATFSDNDGRAVFEGHFEVDEETMEITLDVKDHTRDISDIVDDDDLTTELSQSSPGSIGMGSCTVANSPGDDDSFDNGVADCGEELVGLPCRP